MVYSVISQFDQQKRNIVTSMGWGGTLSMRLISKLSVRHMVWLLGMVDEVRQAIILGPDKVFKFNETDVEKIFGIPAAGTNVIDKSLDRSESVFAYCVVKPCNELECRVQLRASDMTKIVFVGMDVSYERTIACLQA
jgi:hypothetical protein